MKGIILEGVVSAGKSTILRLLQQRIVQEKSDTTKLFISEHYTQRVLEKELHSGQLNAATLATHVHRLLCGVIHYQTLLQNSSFAAEPGKAEAFITLERFLLTYFATLPILLHDYTINKARRQFKQLANCNIRQYIIVLSEQKLAHNLRMTLTHRNTAWADFIARQGGIQQATEQYIGWQARLRQLSQLFAPAIPTQHIFIEDQNYQDVADLIYEKEYR